MLAIDGHADRLDKARELGAEAINFNEEDPFEVIKELTRGIGPDRAIDAVGVDSERPKQGSAAVGAEQAQEFDHQISKIAPKAKPQGTLWKPGDGPSQAITWAVQTLAKAGSLGIIGVYPQTDQFFPIGAAMNKNLRVKMRNCNHRSYIPRLVDMVNTGSIDPTSIITQVASMTDVIEAYKQFDQRRHGWIKVELKPGG
ncbi:MDR/zinc-dependent alcohol dehydrogenase-like family protein [Teichococcus vastitatis]|uniref:Zinc-binding dehydrogenase n=1 Tax=Teichococcus vastitatis TaxID=2307076 RepID=A0ABS9WBM0_9PROT|nr:hypothetical protein [Pseudoroseomonas vastitatis]